MATKKRDLDYLLAQARRIAEHREADAEKEIRKVYKSLLKDLQAYIGDVHARYAVDGSLSIAALQKAGYDARFLEEIEDRIMKSSPKAAKALHELVEDTYKLAYESMVQGVLAQEVDGLNDVFAEAIAITPDQIKNVVKNPVMELALEKNHKDIIYEIKQAVAVGLMNGDRYDTTARRIAELLDADKGAYKRAVRIARTESHRVCEMGNHDAAMRVDEELQKGTTGLRFVKIWRTMKDERVRPQRRKRGQKGWTTKMGSGPNHMKLHGQTVLEDEPFDLGYHEGKKVEAMSPGQSGVAGHDINCRCYASRRMMTDEEYFKATGKHFPGHAEDQQEAEEPATKYKKDYDCELAKKFGTDYYDELHERVENSPDQTLSAVWKKYEAEIKVGDAAYRGHEYCMGKTIYVNGATDKKGNYFQTPYQVTFHESGHAIDSLAKKAITGNAHPYAMHYSSAYENGLFPKTIKDEVMAMVNAKDKELKALFKEKAAAGDARWFYDHGYIDKWYYQRYCDGTYEASRIIPKYAKSYAYSAVQKEVRASGSKIAWGDLSDMLEGATNGRIQCGIGHGKTYWKDRTYGGLADGLATEAFAEMIDSTMANPESLDTIKKYLPKAYGVFREMIENLLK